jgi:TolB protein
MKYQPFLLFLIALVTVSACQNPASHQPSTTNNNPSNATDTLRYPDEKHLKNIRQLTFGGNNAEAYFSFDGTKLVFQAENSRWNVPCDQIFTMPITGYTGSRPTLLSTGKGRTTCSYFLKGDTTILYASTHLKDTTCPQAPRMVNGKYVWHIDNGYDIFTANLNGKIIRQLTKTNGYDAEATVSPDGQKIVFTSIRSGDLELYTMNPDGSNIQQLTNQLGYDGGAFFSPDSKHIIFRASRPKTSEEVATYKDLLQQNLVQPTNMELYVCDADGKNMRQLTTLGNANWAPFFHPSGKKIIFSSNHKSESKRQFNLFMIPLDGSTPPEQITSDKIFDAFPMFSPDGTKLVFASNRFNGGGHDTNLFIADWVE